MRTEPHGHRASALRPVPLGVVLLIAALFFAPASGSASSAGAAQPFITAAARPPQCSTAVGTGGVLRGATTRHVAVSGPPFGVAVTGDRAFVGVGDSLDVFSLKAFTPRFEDELPLAASALGVTATPNGRYLLVADGAGGAMVVRTGTPVAVAGTLASQGGGAIEAAVSPDGRFAFVSLEDSNEVAVFDLTKALASRFVTSGLVGYVPVGQAPVGLAVSLDGHYLYATSESQAGSPQGTLSTIDLKLAELDPARSVVSTVAAGCGAVRVAASAGAVYVTARESDALLRFSAAALASSPRNALQAWLRVGEAPVGLVIAREGTVVIADSDRFSAPNKVSNIAVVGVSAEGHMHVAGYVPTPTPDAFPRDMAFDPQNGEILVSDYFGQDLQVVRLPGAGSSRG